MELNLEHLQSMGAFTTSELVEETVEWQHDGETVSATVYVRPLSYHAAVSEVFAARENADALAARIAASICDANGKPVFTAGDITGDADAERGALDHGLTLALLQAIARASGVGKTRRRSAMKRKSGTSSSSTASAETPSPKPGRD